MLALARPSSERRSYRVLLEQILRPSGKNGVVSFFPSFSLSFNQFESGLPVLEIGRALKGNVANGLIFGKVPLKETDLSAAKIAIDFFDAQMGCARRAVDAWTAVAIRLMVVKDIRRLIGMLIWEERNNFGMWLLKREEKVA